MTYENKEINAKILVDNIWNVHFSFLQKFAHLNKNVDVGFFSKS